LKTVLDSELCKLKIVIISIPESNDALSNGNGRLICHYRLALPY
jgi:hypothetical protein